MTGSELNLSLQALNLTRDQFASKVGKTRRTVQRWLLLDSVPELVADKVRVMIGERAASYEECMRLLSEFEE